MDEDFSLAGTRTGRLSPRPLGEPTDAEVCLVVVGPRLRLREAVLFGGDLAEPMARVLAQHLPSFGSDSRRGALWLCSCEDTNRAEPGQRWSRAQAVRDHSLHVAGLLASAIEGPGAGRSQEPPAGPGRSTVVTSNGGQAREAE